MIIKEATINDNLLNAYTNKIIQIKFKMTIYKIKKLSNEKIVVALVIQIFNKHLIRILARS